MSSSDVLEPLVTELVRSLHVQRDLDRRPVPLHPAPRRREDATLVQEPARREEVGAQLGGQLTDASVVDPRFEDRSGRPGELLDDLVQRHVDPLLTHRPGEGGEGVEVLVLAVDLDAVPGRQQLVGHAGWRVAWDHEVRFVKVQAHRRVEDGLVQWFAAAGLTHVVVVSSRPHPRSNLTDKAWSLSRSNRGE